MGMFIFQDKWRYKIINKKGFFVWLKNLFFDGDMKNYL